MDSDDTPAPDDSDGEVECEAESDSEKPKPRRRRRTRADVSFARSRALSLALVRGAFPDHAADFEAFIWRATGTVSEHHHLCTSAACAALPGTDLAAALDACFLESDYAGALAIVQSALERRADAHAQMQDDDDSAMYSTNGKIICATCGSDRIRSTNVQARSQDEGMTCFYICQRRGCNTKWRGAR